MTGLPPIPEHFRAEMARHQITRPEVCEQIGIHVNTFSNALGTYRPMHTWMAHNIGWAINLIVGRRIFDVDMTRGIMPRPPRILARRPSVNLPVTRRRRRQKRSVKRGTA